jgi:erythromycin esterase-like protein
VTDHDEELADVLRRRALPLTGRSADAALLDAAAGARVVLLGEASHGTHEFYAERARSTRLLIEELGFGAVAVEADWPDADRVNRYVSGRGSDDDADEALAGFRRFPTWMWRNTVVRDFVAWLREWNGSAPGQPVGFHGLDLYSMYGSIEAVLDYLGRVDPEAAARARVRYACLEEFAPESQRYGYAAVLGGAEACEDDVVAQLVELRRAAGDYAARDGRVAEDEFFSAEQNARLVKNAETYYRSMFRGRDESWNVRDSHMAETLDALVAHRSRGGEPARVVVWAHNSHVGDARATDMAERGELNIGQLARERYGDAAFIGGFTGATGTVTAAHEWDGPAERMHVRPPLPSSWEEALSATGLDAFMVPLRGAPAALAERRLERAIGVIYRPATERASHYFGCRLARQFDAVIHLDETRAVEPLDAVQPAAAEPPETYPTGF